MFSNPFKRKAQEAAAPARPPVAASRQREQTVSSSPHSQSSAIDVRSFNYAEEVRKLTLVIGRAKAVEQTIQTVGDAAVAACDSTIIDDLLPATITLDDGQIIDGPASSRKHAVVIAQYREQANAARRR